MKLVGLLLWMMMANQPNVQVRLCPDGEICRVDPIVEPHWTSTHTPAKTFTIPASTSWNWECPKGTKPFYPESDVGFAHMEPESPSERERRKEATKPACVITRKP